MTSRAIVKAQLPTPTEWKVIESISPTVWKAGLFGVGSPEAAAAIMLKGHELGLGLTTSFEFIHIIEGKPTLSPKGALALIQDSPELEELEVKDIEKGGKPYACKVRMRRVTGFEYEVTFTLDDARRAGVVKGQSGWEKYPANMLRWRAIGFCADIVFPDVIGGMKRADEFGAEITPEGDVIDAPEWSVVEVIKSDNHKAKSSLPDLVKRYGADAIVEANDGRIPSTDEELEAAALALEANDE